MTDTTALQDLIEVFNKTDLPSHCESIENAMEHYDGAPDADDFRDWYRETYIDSAEVIYYHSAMDYLRESDPSLQESMTLATDYGLEISNLTSETLATILLQQNLGEDLYDLDEYITAYFEELEETEHDSE